MIRARGVTVRAGRSTLVDAIDLDVVAGEVVALVGPNGAGKSTLLSVLAGDRRPSAGQVSLGGRDLATLSITELARRRAMLPQRSHLALAFTAREVVQLAHPAVTRALADRCLLEVETADLADRLYPTLSGGEQQRVQLARVLAQLMHHPGAALLLDEPTSALDPRHQRTVLALARAAAAEHRAVVVVLHDLTLAARWADRVALLREGRLLAVGDPTSVLTPETLTRAYQTELHVHRTNGRLVIAPA